MKKTASKKKKYIPRVVVKMNTGTRVLMSKKDKASTRQALAKKMHEVMKGECEW